MENASLTAAAPDAPRPVVETMRRMSLHSQIVRHDAADLAAGYSVTQHRLNIAGLIVFCGVAAWIGVHTFSRPVGLLPLVVGLLSGWVLTDFLCGMIHWAGDTWGRTKLPIVGRALVRNFREHHVDPQAITRHGLVQLLGEQAIVAIPVVGLLRLYDPAHDDDVGATALLSLYTMLVASVAANLFHRWAHMRHPPLAARVLQRVGILISFKHHGRHHCAPHLQRYCIAIGWLNPLLDGIRFWRALEWLVWKTTGAVPREDDLGRTAALTILRSDDHCTS